MIVERHDLFCGKGASDDINEYNLFVGNGVPNAVF